LEIIQWRKDGKCFKCDKLFMPCHRQHCKQLFVIEVVDEDDDEGLSPLEGELTISLHALIGIQPCISRTMKIAVTINGTGLLALLDSGPTHNLDRVARVGVVLTSWGGLRVAVANGVAMLCPFLRRQWIGKRCRRYLIGRFQASCAPCTRSWALPVIIAGSSMIMARSSRP
jgi:hypothetical protein